jgi:hypothetical protein
MQGDVRSRRDSYAFVLNYASSISTADANYELVTYPSCSVRVYMALGRGMLLRSIDDGIGHFQGR